MTYTEIKHEKLGEKLYLYEHSSGLKAYVLPKKGFTKKYSAFATHYGSIHNKFIIPGSSEPISVPDGIAHFLEHKLFEQQDGSAMDKFSELGANSNAYTTFNLTSYLFSSTDLFEECLKLLMDFVQNPYITEESVEKEKGIITQEIRMYEDDPGWRVFFNFLRALYIDHPVRIDIAGTAESIANINREVLYTCYNTFYHPSNMIIFCAGDIDVEGTFKLIESNIRTTESKGEIKRLFPEESDKVKQNFIEERLMVGMPIFYMGFKEPTVNLNPKDVAKRDTALKIVLEMILGRSSTLYNELYAEGLINSGFSAEYNLEENYGYSVFGSESRDPHTVREKILKEINNIRQVGLDSSSFERIKKSMYGKFVRQFNYVDKISNAFITAYFKGVSVFDYFDVFNDITLDYMNDIFMEHFNSDRHAISVVNPL